MTRLIQREHLDTGKTVTGYGVEDFIRSYNNHSEAHGSDHKVRDDERFSDYLRRHESENENTNKVQEKGNVSDDKNVTEKELPDDSWTHKEIDSFMEEEYPDVDYKKNEKKALKLESIHEALE